MQKLFLDTNIVVDFLGEREEVYQSAARVMTVADQKKIKIFTTSNTISTSYYLLSKYESPKAALEKIRKFKVLCSVSAMSDEVIDKVIASDFKDFEDALQNFSALDKKDINIIITRNISF